MSILKELNVDEGASGEWDVIELRTVINGNI